MKNAETDTEFIDSDHFPVIADITIKLKAKPKTETHQRIKYGESTNEQYYNYNNKTPE